MSHGLFFYTTYCDLPRYIVLASLQIYYSLLFASFPMHNTKFQFIRKQALEYTCKSARETISIESRLTFANPFRWKIDMKVYIQ